MTRPSDPEDLALHGIRVLGFPTASRIASRFGLDPGTTRASLLDFGARGWARATSFAGSSGWSLTEAERAGRFRAACTDWQIRPTRLDPMALNDHSGWRWDERVLKTLSSVAARPDRDSCHTVWIQFHEDLLATLGIPRGGEGYLTRLVRAY